MPGFATVVQGKAPLGLALEARVACVPGPMGLYIWRGSSWQAPTPSALHRQQTKIRSPPPSLSEKEAYLLVRGASYWSDTHLEAYRGQGGGGDVQGREAGGHNPCTLSASLQLTGISQKEAYALV